MLIDMHNHTGWGSGDTHQHPSDLIERAKLWHLDGICFTEHNFVWDSEKVAMLREKHNFLVIAGAELDTPDYDHVLAFGLPGPRRWSKLPTVLELRKLADEHGGVLVRAHPFRKVSLPYVDSFVAPEVAKFLDWACAEAVYDVVDAVEAFNGLARPRETLLVNELCRRLGKRTTGGSDAHRLNEAAVCFTVFHGTIRDDHDFLEALKAGDFHGGDWESEGLPDPRY
ncbi:MAG: PHP domain-containing protein [Chloroflexi bacterium]|nr:PHP domain-containing protein [Chloroflexota bacterium]